MHFMGEDFYSGAMKATGKGHIHRVGARILPE